MSDLALGVALSDFDEIVRLAGDDLVKMGKNYQQQIGKKLRLGHTSYVIEHDMLGEGHQHFTPAGKYFQAIREVYSRAHTMEQKEAQAMEHQADLQDAYIALDEAKTDQDKLRAKAKIKRYSSSLKDMLIQMQDIRMEMQCLNRIIKRHEEEVEKKYNGDIELAQPDIWKAKMRYRLELGERVNNIPMPIEEKAKLQAPFARKEAFGVAQAEIGYQRDWEERIKELTNAKKPEAISDSSPLQRDQK